MKKIVFLAAIILAAALFFGCSNSSDNLLPFILSGESSKNGESKLPMSVGTNELNGKSFNSASGDKLTFTENERIKSKETNVGASQYNNAYKLIEKYTYSYTYNSTTRQVFCIQKKAQRSVIRGETETVIPEPKFSTDAEFIEGFKKALKIEFDKSSEDDLTARAKGKRYSTFSQFGYKDVTCEKAVPDETIAEYNKYNAASQTLVNIHAYEFKNNNKFYFMEYDFRFPKGLTLSQIYNDYYALFESNNRGNGNWSLFNTFGSSPEITEAPGTAGYRISSITSSAINTCQDAALNGNPALKWTYTQKEREFKYKVEDHSQSNYVSYIVDELGTFEITYAAANNIPDPTARQSVEYNIVQ